MKQIHAPMTTDRFKSLAIAKFPYLDYSESIFVDSLTKIKFKCPHHGQVSQDPYTHLNSENGCPVCGRKDRARNRMANRVKKLKEDCLIKHGDKYTYFWDTYKGMSEYMIIACPIHGNFEQTPASHLYGRGCPKCANIKRGLSIRLGRELILTRFRNIYGNTYDYNLVPETVLHEDHITVICQKHGKFNVTVANHLRQSGCPGCIESHGERAIRNLLIQKGIPFKAQFTFADCKYKGKLRFDFYLPESNILIEYQGRQHYALYDPFGGEKEYSKIIIRDRIKKEYCAKNNIRLEEIRFDQNIKDRLVEIISQNPALTDSPHTEEHTSLGE